jgi:DNA-binding GntR family transcriptional regulator
MYRERIRFMETQQTTKRKISKTPLGEQIREQLIEDIFHRKYKPGDRIVESALARSLNVSQASVREALRSLIAMGFLESEPYKGITVRNFTSKDLIEVYTVRIALESLAAQQAVSRITPEEIAELERIVDEMIDAGKEGDTHRRTHLNNLFHEKLVEASGNKLLVQIFQYMRFATWSTMTGILSKMDPVSIAARHRILIEALKNGDPVKMAESIREHIESTGKPISDILDSETVE